MTERQKLIERLRECQSQAYRIAHKLTGGDSMGMEIFATSFGDAAEILEADAAQITSLKTALADCRAALRSAK